MTTGEEKPRRGDTKVQSPIQLPHQFQPAEGRLILRLNAPTDVELAAPAFDALRIERNGDGTMKIAWPVGLTNYWLERVSPLDAVWQQVNGTFAIEGISRVFDAPGTPPAEFFQLRQQP